MKLKEIEIQKAEVNKLHQTFGLERMLTDIESQHKEKNIEELIKLSTKC